MTARPKYTDDQMERASNLLKGASSTHPITSEELGEKLGLEDIEGNWNARDLITEVMRKKRVPVVARTTGKARGYWVPQTETDVKEYVQDLFRRSHGILGRAALVDFLWHESHPGEDSEPSGPLDEY
jgi:hypothetical protein